MKKNLSKDMYRVDYVGKDGSSTSYDLGSSYAVISWITREICEFFNDFRVLQSLSVYSYRTSKLLFRIEF